MNAFDAIRLHRAESVGLFDEWHERRKVAASHTATCRCGRVCDVQASFRQATRQEPPRFLGYHFFCPPCGFEFPAEKIEPR